MTRPPCATSTRCSPVDATDFADPAARQRWREEEGLVVFSMVDPSNPLREVDLFCEIPIPVEELWRDAVTVDLQGTVVRIASIPHPIALRTRSGRPQDLADIEARGQIAGQERTDP